MPASESDILLLNCCILGEERNVFSVEISKTKPVSILKDLIKEKKKHTFRGIDADTLNLWKVSTVTSILSSRY
jgi:hypothetical protein